MAVSILKNEGFDVCSTEDKFGNLTLKMLGMRPRYRLYVSMYDIEKISQVLKKIMKNKFLDFI